MKRIERASAHPSPDFRVFEPTIMVNGRGSEDAQSSRSKIWTSIHEFAEKLQYAFSQNPPTVSESGGSWVSRDVSISVVQVKMKSNSSLSNLESFDSALGGCQFANFGPAACRAHERSMSGSLIVEVPAEAIDNQGAPSSNVENTTSLAHPKSMSSNHNESTMMKSTDKLDSATDEHTEPTVSLNTLCTGTSSLQHVEPEQAEPQEIVGPCGRRYKIVEEIEEVHNTPSMTRHVVRVVIAPCKTYETSNTANDLELTSNTANDLEQEVETQPPQPVDKRGRLRNRISKLWKSAKREKSSTKADITDDPTQSSKPTFSSSTTDSEKSGETNSILQTSSGEKSDFRDERCCNAYANLFDAADSFQDKNETWLDRSVGRGFQYLGQERTLTEDSNDILSLNQPSGTFSDRSSTSLQEVETSSEDDDNDNDDDKLETNGKTSADASLATATETWSQSISSTNADSLEALKSGSNVNDVALDCRQTSTILKRQLPEEENSKDSLREGMNQEYQPERMPEKSSPPLTPLRGILKRRKVIGLDQIANGDESSRHDATLILQASPGDNKVSRDEPSSEGITPKVRNLSVDKHQRDWIKPKSKSATDLQTGRDMLKADEATEDGVEVGLTLLHDTARSNMTLRESSHSKSDDAFLTTETQTSNMDGDPSLKLNDHATGSENSATTSTSETGDATPQDRTQKRPGEIVTVEAETKDENHCESTIASTLLKSGTEQNSLVEPPNASEGHLDTDYLNDSGLSTAKGLAAPYHAEIVETDTELESQTKVSDGMSQESNDRTQEEPPRSMSSSSCARSEGHDAKNADVGSSSLNTSQHDISRFPVEVATDFTRDALDTEPHMVENSESVEPLLEPDSSPFKSGNDLQDNTRDMNKIELLLTDAFGSGLEFTESQNEEVVRLFHSEAASEKREGDKSVAGFKLLAAVQMLVNRMMRDKDISKEEKITNGETFSTTGTRQMVQQYSAASETEVNTLFKNENRSLVLDGDVVSECRDDHVVDERSDQTETVMRLEPDQQPPVAQTQESATPDQVLPQADKADTFLSSPSERDTFETELRKEEVRSLHLTECDESQVGFATADKWVDFKKYPLHHAETGSDEPSNDVPQHKWTASPEMDAYVPNHDFEGCGIEVFETPGDLYGLRIDDDWGIDGTYVSTLVLMQPHVTKKVPISKRSIGRRKRGGLLSADNNYPASQRSEYENLSSSCSVNKDDDVVAKPSLLSSIGRLWMIGSLVKNRRMKSKDSAVAESSNDFFNAGNERVINLDKDTVPSSDFLQMAEAMEQHHENPSNSVFLTTHIDDESRGLTEQTSPPRDSVVRDRRSFGVLHQPQRGNWVGLGRRRKSMTDLRGNVAPTFNRSPRHNIAESHPVIAPDGVEVFIA